MKRFLLFLGLFFIGLSVNVFPLEKETEGKIEYSPVIYMVPPTCICYKVPGEIIIDGDLSEWRNVPKISEFVNILGEKYPAPQYKTYTKIAYDEKGLYLAAFMEEPHIWSYYKKHDSMICQENAFEVFIDLTGDTHNYLEYEINALGTEWDLFLDKPYRDVSVRLSGWEFAGMRSAVVVDGTVNDPSDRDKSWSVEIFMPWEAINQTDQVKHKRKGAPGNGEQIRMNLARVEWNTEIVDDKYIKSSAQNSKMSRVNYWVWAPAGEVNMHLPELWGYVQFSDKIAGSGTDHFQEKPEEKTKWILRQLYYRQMEYRKIKGEFANTAQLLQASDFCTEEQLLQLTVERTTSLFEISLLSEEGEIWRINNKGLVWK